MRTAEVLASRILFWGGLVSVVVMTLGIVGFTARGGLKPEFVAEWRRVAPVTEERPADVFVSAGEVGRALGRWPVEPLAIVAAGILLLLVTPLTAVTAVFVVFAVGGERRYAGVAALLLAALLLSLVFAGSPK